MITTIITIITNMLLVIHVQGEDIPTLTIIVTAAMIQENVGVAKELETIQKLAINAMESAKLTVNIVDN